MAGQVAFHLDRPVRLAAPRAIGIPATETLPEVPLKRYGIDEGLEILLHGNPQATPPVAGLVVPEAAIALTRLRAIIIRCTSDGPS
jgi:hypothetical protein